MDIKPVESIEKPKYPVKEDIKADLLKNSMPKRWVSSTAAKIAFGTLAAMSLAGCATIQKNGASSVQPEETPSIEQTDTIYTQTAGVPLAPTVTVAPLFLHGEGRGAFGCVMVAPPVFLSEEDALAVINEAAKEYGLNFSSKESLEFENVLQPATDINPDGLVDGEPTAESSDKIINLKADFTDSEHGVAIEFISVDDVKAWQISPSGASVEEYDTQDAAAQLSEALENAYPVGYTSFTAGVLYDPCEFSEDETEARSMSSEQLKSQAKDFFEWLRQQGII